MLQEYDCVVIGTGLAPLASAKKLIENGKSVLVLNPDQEFFNENTELPFNPILLNLDDVNLEEKIINQKSEQLFNLLNPEYPGSVDIWPESKLGFYDRQVPRIFSRERVWVTQKNENNQKLLSKNFKLIDGIKVAYLIPGASPQKLKNSDSLFGVYTQNYADVEVDKYQIGFLRYINEKLSKKDIHYGVWSIDFTKNGLHFHTKDGRFSVLVKGSVHIFWTPRLMSLLSSFLKKHSKEFIDPLGRRPYVQWTLKSKEKINPKYSAVIKNAFLLAKITDDSDENALSLFIKESYLETDYRKAKETLFCGEGTFKKTAQLLEEFLGWQKFTLSNLKVFYCTEWTDKKNQIQIKNHNYKINISKFSDGFIGDVLKTGIQAAESVLN